MLTRISFDDFPIALSQLFYSGDMVDFHKMSSIKYVIGSSKRGTSSKKWFREKAL